MRIYHGTIKATLYPQKPITLPVIECDVDGHVYISSPGWYAMRMAYAGKDKVTPHQQTKADKAEWVGRTTKTIDGLSIAGYIERMTLAVNELEDGKQGQQ